MVRAAILPVLSGVAGPASLLNVLQVCFKGIVPTAGVV